MFFKKVHMYGAKQAKTNFSEKCRDSSTGASKNYADSVNDQHAAGRYERLKLFYYA